jgi:hypothetical protein
MKLGGVLKFDWLQSRVARQALIHYDRHCLSSPRKHAPTSILSCLDWARGSYRSFPAIPQPVNPNALLTPARMFLYPIMSIESIVLLVAALQTGYGSGLHSDDGRRPGLRRNGPFGFDLDDPKSAGGSHRCSSPARHPMGALWLTESP